VFGAYTDYISPRFTACAILAAVEHRRQTGEGQYIDQSQAEASTHFLGPAILDFSANGRNQERMGNADLQYAPHGVYPAKGEDRWVAIVCKTDGEWRALCSLMKRNDLVNDARFVTAAGRLQHRDELDGAVGEWTATLDAEEAEHLLQSRGIAAHQVQNASECYRDAQLLHRGHFVDVEHPTYDKTTVEGPRAVLSRTPAKVMRRAPMLGEHNEYILKEILGYDDEKIATLAATGVLG
jgi:benzylsuccinate CoA-transferase BbsF subunit